MCNLTYRRYMAAVVGDSRFVLSHVRACAVTVTSVGLTYLPVSIDDRRLRSAVAVVLSVQPFLVR